jgi:UDP-GlcNAc3NAcA epimerase
MKIVTVVGARPQFVKAAALCRAIRDHNRNEDLCIEDIIVHTGQHYDANMSSVFFEELAISPPSYNLGIGSGTHAQQTGKMLVHIEEILQKEHPDVLLLYGDTNSTLAGALAASKLHIPIAHVEAGLRSFNRQMPEEVNRVLTDHMSNVLFCPTKQAVTNLSKEGILRNVYNVGDIMYDAFLHFSNIAEQHAQILQILNLQGTEKHTEDYYLATIHRAENTDNANRLNNIFDAFASLDQKIILPLHPRTRNALARVGITPSPNIHMIAPVSYLEMCQLLKHANLVLTDSGGLQKEAYFSGKPCITLRDETEWVETVETGWNLVVGASQENILTAVQRFQQTSSRPRLNLYGSGDTARQIISVLLNASTV